MPSYELQIVEWDPTTEYEKGDAVCCGGLAYKCQAKTSAGQRPGSGNGPWVTVKWLPPIRLKNLVERLPSDWIKRLPHWDETKSYPSLEMVVFDGHLYRCEEKAVPGQKPSAGFPWLCYLHDRPLLIDAHDQVVELSEPGRRLLMAFAAQEDTTAVASNETVHFMIYGAATQGSIYDAISQVKEALGQQSIKNFPGIGYKLGLAAKRISDSSDAIATNPPRSIDSKEKNTRQLVEERVPAHFNLSLRVLIVGIAVFVVGSFMIGKWVGSKNANRESPTGLGLLIGSLDTSDQQVDDLIRAMKAAHADSEISIYVNLRGLNVYRAESMRAAKGSKDLRRSEIERALRWFQKAQELDRSASFPYYNIACMFALLHNASEAMRSLGDLYTVTAPGRKSDFEQRLIHDKDFCGIDDDPSFQAYLRDQLRIRREVDCSGVVSVPRSYFGP